MNRAVRRFATVVTLIFLLIPALEAAEQARPSANTLPPMTLWQARRAAVAGFGAAYAERISTDPSSFRFTLDAFEFDGKIGKRSEHFKIDLKTLEPVFTKRWRGGYLLKNEAGNDLQYPLPRVWFSWGLDNFAARAESLATALNSLREFALSAGDPLRTFQQQAASWRALPSKPTIPERVRAQRLLAENAVQEKNPAEALIHYETGLELYPSWTQGYFNAALIAAELGYFAEAVEHMQAYLELVPDAPDAQSARDQIVIWQYKAKTVPAANPDKARER